MGDPVAKLGDLIKMVPVKVTEKTVVRKIVTPSKPRNSDDRLLRAVDRGDFTSAVRAISDINNALRLAQRSQRRSLRDLIIALRSFEGEYNHTRKCVGRLPPCAERECLFSSLENIDVKAGKLWTYVLERVGTLEKRTRRRR